MASGDTIPILPYGSAGEAMLWQARSDFFFRMAGGYLGIVPSAYQEWPIVTALGTNDDIYIPSYDQFKAFLVAHNVRAVVVEERMYGSYAKLCETLDVNP